ncbi:hypothetical protein L195_g049342 [Trifolium pratense]|uniref:Uncharacterized protein n=1 Tax=Trifolium pratense TaxID=57577 RepID=A0A2K3JNU6_TRIPR|nr:hypothetical protein L195_g049342 [Trifolium pratense]
MVAARLMMDVVERANQKRLTLLSHEEIELARAEAARKAEEDRKVEEEKIVQETQRIREESKRINRLEAERLEAERLVLETPVLADLEKFFVPSAEFVGSSSDKGKAPMDLVMEDKLRVLEDAIGTQRSDHQQLAGKVDNLDTKVDGLHVKFDKILALLSSSKP